jgi:hypothetical protein
MSCASSGHITKLKQSIFALFDINELIKWLKISYERTLLNIKQLKIRHFLDQNYFEYFRTLTNTFDHNFY